MGDELRNVITHLIASSNTKKWALAATCCTSAHVTASSSSACMTYKAEQLRFGKTSSACLLSAGSKQASIKTPPAGAQQGLTDARPWLCSLPVA
jgi:hypothetical protein